MVICVSALFNLKKGCVMNQVLKSYESVHGTVIAFNDQTFHGAVIVSTFPGGEACVFFSDEFQAAVEAVDIDRLTVIIKPQLKNSHDVMILARVNDILREMNFVVEVIIMYLPYGRDDRQFYEGKGKASFGLETFAKLLNAMEFSVVHLIDPHSKVAASRINNVITHDAVSTLVTSYNLLENICKDAQRFVIVAPDTGALHRANDFASQLSKQYSLMSHITIETVFCKKTRDGSDVSITLASPMSDIVPDFGNATVVVIDDICDGGATFVELAKVIYDHTPHFAIKSLHLVVTSTIQESALLKLAHARYDSLVTLNHLLSLDPANIIFNKV